jgi:hypothetical protein
MILPPFVGKISFIKLSHEWRILYMHAYVYLYLAEFFLEWEIFQTKVVEKLKTHVWCSMAFFRKSCRLWDNVEKHERARQATDDNIIRRMRFACWITKATDTPSEYVILNAFPWQQRKRERASMLRYTRMPVLFIFVAWIIYLIFYCYFKQTHISCQGKSWTGCCMWWDLVRKEG